MLTFYYARPSLYSRPVWLALLEKKLDFEPVSMRLNGDQFESEFMAISPFSHIPVLIDDGLRVIESMAILDYLEAKYPTPALLPTEAERLATVRQVQMVAINELLPAAGGLILHQDNPRELEYSQLRAKTVLAFFENLLEDKTYFGGECLSLAEVVAGTLVPDLPKLGIPLTDYPKLDAWTKSLLSRDSWQQIALSAEEFADFQRRLKVMFKMWQKRRRQRAIALQQNQPSRKTNRL